MANRIVRLLLLFSLFSACKRDVKQVKSKQELPNVILIMADDLGYGHLGCYGQEKIATPYLDRLAAEGMRFTRAYAGSAVCAPSRSVLMTGLHAGHTPVRGNGGGASLREQDITLAQMFKKKGYLTGLFGKWGLGDEGDPGVPNQKGFDEFYGYLNQLHAQFYYPEFLWQNQEKIFFPENRNMAFQTYSHDLIMQKATEFIRRNKDTTFFCYLPVAIPHHEFIAPRTALEQYQGRFPEEPVDFWREGYALPTEPKATMAAMITHLDATIGSLLEALDVLGLAENTLVLFTSDNGPAVGPLENPDFFEAAGKLRGYKGDLYEGGIRVPFLVRWPGKIKAGSTSGVPVYFGDIFPTMIELVDLDGFLSQQMDGLSILPVFKGHSDEMPEREYIYWEVGDYQRVAPFDLIAESFSQAVLLNQWKGVKNPMDQSLELYDLAADPDETQDLAAENPDLVARITRIMAENHHPAPPQEDIPQQEAAARYIPKKQ